MFNIHKISQRYDALEDRIEVAIQNESGHVVRLWLTQRLSNRMLVVLTKWLPDLPDDPENANSSDETAPPSHAPTSAQDVAVNFNSAAEEGLLTTVDMTHQEKDYILTFRWGVTGIASIRMGLEQLDSFISGLAQLYKAAHWDMKPFPEMRVKTMMSKAPDFDDFPEDAEGTPLTIH